MAVNTMEAVAIGKDTADRTLGDLRCFIRQQIPDEESAQQMYQEASSEALSLGRGEEAKTFSAIAMDESRHRGLLKDMDIRLEKEGVEASPCSYRYGGNRAMPLSEKEIKAIATSTADEVMERVYGVTDLTTHIMEHEILGHARVIDKATAENPEIPCKCFSFEGEDYCWKPGYLGLISSKKNPEQIATCQIRVPASPGAQQRFAKIKGAIQEAAKEHKEKGGGLEGWMTTVSEKLSEKGVSL